MKQCLYAAALKDFIALLAKWLAPLQVAGSVRQHEAARAAEAVLNRPDAEIIVLVGKPGHNLHSCQCCNYKKREALQQALKLLN
jgi:hypothetical protein